MPMPLPTTLPEPIKMQLVSYKKGLQEFAETNGIPRGTVYGVLVKGGAKLRGLRNLIKCAEVLGVPAADLLAILNINDIQIRYKKTRELISSIGVEYLIDMDQIIGVRPGTFHSLMIRQGGLFALNKCKLISDALELSLEDFFVIMVKK
jgi:hypothetical protein